MRSQLPVNIVHMLLVDDDPVDVRLTQKALESSKVHVSFDIARDGVEALAFLRREGQYANAARPDLILLDLNMPRKNGREVLAELKADPNLKSIPVVILTVSQAEEDILQAYNLGANCYVSKPVDLRQFETIVRMIENFWFTVVKMPPK